MKHQDAVTVMGFDFGLARIGVAVGQTVSRTATALKVLQAKSGSPTWNELTTLVDEWQPDLLVIGLPQYEDRTPHPLEDNIKRFSRRLHGRYKLPVTFIDEHLSSVAASHSGLSNNGELDAVAAMMILESWFEQSAPAMTTAN